MIALIAHDQTHDRRFARRFLSAHRLPVQCRQLPRRIRVQTESDRREEAEHQQQATTGAVQETITAHEFSLPRIRRVREQVIEQEKRNRAATTPKQRQLRPGHRMLQTGIKHITQNNNAGH